MVKKKKDVITTIKCKLKTVTKYDEPDNILHKVS